MLSQQPQFFGLTIGIVRDDDDPEQNGRLKIYIPTIDSGYNLTEDLPWAMYVSPLGGSVRDIKVGREDKDIQNISSYGMWAIPKIGTHVLCGCLDGDPNMRFYLGSVFQPNLNKSLPLAMNDPDTKEMKGELWDPLSVEEDPVTDDFEAQKIEHIETNLKEAGLDKDQANFKTRAWERAVAYPLNRQDSMPDDDGYAKKPYDPEHKNSQVISLTSPGRHVFLMSDVNDHCRMRLRTTEGHQIIMDDTNERIYISTAKGRNWIEIDEDGRIFVYAKDEINIRSEDDINIKSEKNINIKAKKKINLESMEDEVNVQARQHIFIKSTQDKINIEANRGFSTKVSSGSIKIEASKDIDMSATNGKFRLYSRQELNLKADADVRIQSQENMQLKSRNVYQSVDATIYISVPKKLLIDNDIVKFPVTKAFPAELALKSEPVPDLNLKLVEPEKESWTRPSSKQTRNPKWQP